MKKLFIFLISLFFLSPFQTKADFSGFGITLGGSYSSSGIFSSSSLTSPFNTAPGKPASIELNRVLWGKSYIDLGYTYVISTGIPLLPSVFLGGSVVGGSNSFKVDSQTPGNPSFDKDQEFSQGFYAGAKVNGGIIFTVMAVKLMAEIDTQQFSCKYQNQTFSQWGYGGYSLGVGLDFSAPLIPIVLGIGINFKYPPRDVAFQINGRDQTFGFNGDSFEIFAEIGIRL